MKRLISTCAAILIFLGSVFFLVKEATAAKPKPVENHNEEYYDLLIEGIDRRNYQATGRSDVIMIVHCEPDRITLFSLPRDSLVQVRGSLDKINHAYAYGGIRLSKSTIERFLRFKIDNYITVDFETFVETVNTVKLLTDDGKLIGAENFLASADNLLKWLRFRGYALGDRRRCQRHQLFIKRVLEYAQDMFNNKQALFSQVVKTCLKITETDLTYEHVAELFNTYKNINLETNLERFVLPGNGDSRYRDNNSVSRTEHEENNMPNFNATVMSEGLQGDAAEKRKEELVNSWRKEQVLVSYYIPKYDWSLVTYIKWFREHGVKMNYEEVDTLRK